MRKIILTLYITLLSLGTQAQYPTSLDAQMREYNLVNIHDIDNTILVDLKYSTEDNFVGKDMYGSLNDAYFEREFALRIAHAQQILRERYPDLRLLIYDAARPISVQRAMRRCVEGTPLESFVADGTKGGRHNYGVAVDLTIATSDGTPLEMGAPFDDFSNTAAVKGDADTSEAATRTPEVYRAYAEEQVRSGVLSRKAADNRMLLIEVMHEAGLVPYRREWWHFEELMSMSETRATYKLLNF